MTTADPLVLCEVKEAVALLTLNHPEKRNALSRAMLIRLKEELVAISYRKDVRVAILRANGTAFSAGHDLRELTGSTEAEYAALFALCTEVMEEIRLLPQPVIAAVQGVATAAGCQLVASCDLAVAAEDATFATPGVKIGLFCSTPAVALCRAVPMKKALEMLLTGNPITAQEAERIGLINHVVRAARLEGESWQLAQQIAAASAYAVALGKRAFYEQFPLDRPAAYCVAERVMVENAQADDAHEGIVAFLEKRVPRWNN
jgi:enoyl-CoA hydratase/carnithine racemase